MKLKKQFRHLSLGDIREIDNENSFEFSFSSEFPVERFFGTEILSHEQGAADLSRLNDGAALLWNHDMADQIGVVDSAEIRGKKGYAKVRFGSSTKAKEIYTDVKSGIIRNVSFGYQIMEMDQGGEKTSPVFTATRWMPYEISFVSIPADPTIGVGRSADEDEVEVKINQKGNKMKKRNVEEKEIEEVKVEAAATEEVKVEETKVEAVEEVKEQVNIQEIKSEAVLIERARVTAIQALGEKFGKSDLARQLIDGGKSLEEARIAVLETIKEGQKPVTGKEAEIGLTEKEKRSYSFLRAINALSNPTDKKAQEAARFEMECSDAAAEQAGKASRGLMIPVDVLAHKRDLTVGSASAGGNLVATDLLSGSFIELLRNKSVVIAAGAQQLNGLKGSVAIPKQSGAATAYWVAESGAPSESAQTVAQVTMSPKTIGAYTDWSRKLMLQSSIDVENMVRNDLAQVLALGIDYAALYGSGSSNQPLGLKGILAAYNSASQELNLAAATPTFAEIISLESKVSANNALAGNMKYLVNASMAGSLKGKEKASGYPVYVLEGGMMNGYSTLISNQVASGDVFFGNFADMILGFWSGLDLMVDPYGQATSGTVRLVALQDCDIAVRHEVSFSRGNDTP
jgi:HK97 family phage major capsid protein/HK97 family phage prohead protease